MKRIHFKNSRHYSSLYSLYDGEIVNPYRKDGSATAYFDTKFFIKVELKNHYMVYWLNTREMCLAFSKHLFKKTQIKCKIWKI